MISEEDLQVQRQRQPAMLLEHTQEDEDAQLMRLVDQQLEDFVQLQKHLQLQQHCQCQPCIEPSIEEQGSRLTSDQSQEQRHPPDEKPLHQPPQADFRLLVANLWEQLMQLESQMNPLLPTSPSSEQPYPQQQQDASDLLFDAPDPSWSIRAQQESQTRQLSEGQNNQLRVFLKQQVTISHQIRQALEQQVVKNAMLWMKYDAMKALTDLARSRLGKNQISDVVPSPIEAALEPASQTRYKRLVHRLDFAFHQMQLVFQGHSTSIPDQYVNGWLPYHQLKVQYVSNANGEDFVELAGSTVTCFDANTLMELLWACFASKRPGPCVDSLTKLVSNIQINCSARKQAVDEERVHWEGGFDDTVVGLLDVTFESNVLLSKRQNTFVMDGTGRINLKGLTAQASSAYPSLTISLPNGLDFNKTTWYRVEALADGRSVVHHVHRAQPIARAVDDTLSAEQLRDLKRLEMEILTEVLQHAHFQMSLHCRKLILQQFLDQTRVHGDGWPLQGIEF